MSDQLNGNNSAMTPDLLAALAPGFGDPVHDTQIVFRKLLDALARPGTIGLVETPLPAATAADASPARAGLAGPRLCRQ